MVALFVLTSFLTASLLFLVQPMVGRMVLPAFGGSPQVWTTSMLFFQVALLIGYGYTHVTTARLSERVQPWVHLGVAVLPAFFLPIALSVIPSGRGGLAPSLELLAGLSIGVAAPFVLIATSGPLVQRWFSWSSHPQAQDPYFLYAAGNVGSAAGLLAYPFVLEPLLTIEAQSRVWAAGYALAVVLLAACAFVVHRSREATTRPPRGLDSDKQPAFGDERSKAKPSTPSTAVRAVASTADGIPRRRLGYWMFLAFVPSSLMLAVTSLLSTDIAAVPLLWIVPLGTYLLTFTIAFSSFGPAALRWSRFATPLVAVAALTVRPAAVPILIALGVQVLLVLVGGSLAHGLLADSRPAATHLTRFYLVVAVGGALGGVFNSLIAPLLFPTLLEYGITVALVLGLVIRWREPVAGLRAHSSPLVRVPVMAGLILIPIAGLLLLGIDLVDISGAARAVLATLLALPLLTPLGSSAAVGVAAVAIALLPQLLQLTASDFVERTFFGVHRVVTEGETRSLVHGTTVHGTQNLSTPEDELTAISYYHPDEPFGDIMELARGSESIGVLGLGAGGIAAYGELGQQLVFHEIDPAVVDIAWEWFTYLDRTPADVDVVLGDGRLTLSESRQSYDLLVMDAFTSDAVPVHLLTVEAFESYLDAIDSEGIIAVNISNRYLDLRPVLAAARAELGIDGIYASGDGDSQGATASRWVALARESETLAPLRAAGWEEFPTDEVLWTDQRSSLFSVLIR
jgi:hypothetical protein